jgi:hypothetical protein
MKKNLIEFRDDVAIPFLVYSGIGLASIFTVVFIAKLGWVVGKFAWNLI